MADTGNQDRGSMVMTIIDKLLAFMSTPWKAVAVVALLIVCGVGAFVYDQRVRIADAILTNHGNAEPVLLVERFSKDAGKLLQDTRGDVTVLIAVHLVDNISDDRMGYDRYGHVWIPVDGPRPIISPDGSAALLVRFLRNEVVCVDTTASPNEEAVAMAKEGYMRACIVIVPPVLGVGIGALVVGWKEPLKPELETRAGYVMSSAAMKFATW